MLGIAHDDTQVLLQSVKRSADERWSIPELSANCSIFKSLPLADIKKCEEKTSIPFEMKSYGDKRLSAYYLQPILPDADSSSPFPQLESQNVGDQGSPSTKIPFDICHCYWYIVRSAISGGKLGLSIGILVYIVLVGTIIRFFQTVHKRDERMRAISAHWIEETRKSVLESK